ncbi:MAG: hypothetical protein ABI614_00275 [Planctomycetota bacterium]
MSVQKYLCWVIVASLAVVTATNSPVLAERRTKDLPVTEETRTVGLFEAMDKGEVEVRFIPKDSTEATVLVENKTDKPLTIQFPEAFAAVHVLGQFGGGGGGFGGGGMGGGGMGGGGMGGGGGGQGMGGGGGGMGGGMGGMGGGMGGMGGGGGFFNVAPQKVTKVKVPCVCLEHAKPDPTPRMKYKIVPIETLTKDPNVIEVCKMLGHGEIPQNAAQAAAWNLANGLSWQELAVKNRIELRTIGYSERYFAPQELALASRIAGEAAHRAQALKSTQPSPGERPYTTGGLQAGGQ